MVISNALENESLSLKTKMFIKSLYIITILFSANVNANCSKTDVTYYLKEGFKHEQIVKLCSSQKITPQKPAEPSNDQLIKKEVSRPNLATKKTTAVPPESSAYYDNQDAIFLATAVEAYDVEVTDDAIMFKRKDCFNYGQEDWNEFQDRACPHVKYIISRKGLKIVDRDNGFFGIGATALFISGNIEANILDLDTFQEKFHEDIMETIQKNTEKLEINVRSSMPQKKVEEILLKLAK